MQGNYIALHICAYCHTCGVYQMLTSIKPLIYLDDEAREYTNGDKLSGYAVVKLDKDVDVEDIVIRYYVRARTTVVVNHGQSSSTYHETFTIHEESNVVFPPAGLSGTTFTLQSGEHSFQYLFTIPNKQLPGSYRDTKKNNTFSHIVEVKVRRPTWYKANPEARVVFEFFPSDLQNEEVARIESCSRPIKVDLHGSRRGIFSRRRSEVKLTAWGPNTVAANDECALDVVIASEPSQGDQMQPLKVLGVTVKLKSHVVARAKSYVSGISHKDSHRDIKKTLLVSDSIVDAEGTTIYMKLDALKLGQIAPTYNTPILQVNWCLSIVVDVSSCNRLKAHHLRHEFPVNVVPPSSAPPTYMANASLPQYKEQDEQSLPEKKG